MISLRRCLAIAIALLLGASACAGDSNEAAEQLETAVAATVLAMTSAEPTAAPTPSPPPPTATVDPSLRIEDERVGAALAVAFLEERDRRESLTSEIEALEEEVALLSEALHSVEDGRPEWLNRYYEALEQGGFEAATAFHEGLMQRWDQLKRLEDEIALLDTSLADLDNDGSDPEFELLQFFRQVPNFHEVDLADITSDRLHFEVGAAADALATARSTQDE